MKRDKQEFSFKKLCSNLPNSTYIFAALFLAFVIFIPNFGSATNLSTLIGQAAILMVLSSAMSLAIITGGIDLSVGGLVSLIGIVIAQLIGWGVNEGAAILLGLLTAAAFGFLNGIVVVKLKVAPFIATFGMMGVAQGLANTFSNSRAVYLPSENITVIPVLQMNLLEWMFPSGNILTINVQVLITVLVLAAVILLFKKRFWAPISTLWAATGRRPSSPTSARMSGISGCM